MPDVFDDLDAATLGTIGDPITYTPSGGSAVSLQAWVDHSPDVIDFGVTAGVTVEASVQVRKSDIATPNKDGDRIYLARTGQTYRMSTWPLHSRCGRYWNMALVKVPA